MPVPNSVPRFIATPVVGMGVLSAANANRDGTGTLVTVVPPAPKTGTEIELIRAVATGTTTAGMVRLFLDDGSGAAAKLYAEIPIAAITPSASVAVFDAELAPTKPLILPENYSLKASTHNAEGFNVIATGGDH